MTHLSEKEMDEENLENVAIIFQPCVIVAPFRQKKLHYIKVVSAPPHVLAHVFDYKEMLTPEDFSQFCCQLAEFGYAFSVLEAERMEVSLEDFLDNKPAIL